VLAVDLTPLSSGGTPIASIPTFSPTPGTYSGTQSVSLSDTTPNAQIYYTTNNTTPTTASMLYGSPISVNATTTINAIAVASGYTASPVTSGTYTILAPSAATPILSVAAGTYSSAQSVSLSDTTPGAVIYYTTNGATPTVGSAQYTAPLTVSATTTINAIAIASGYAPSAVASATYTISTLPVAVSLAGLANLYGLANSGTAVTGGGVDGHGNAFAANLLGTSVTWSGGTFTLAAPGPGSAVTSTTIPLPAGNDTAISVLGSAVNGAQVNQVFVVTYSDGSTQSFTQSLSDWYTPANYSGETLAATMAYRIKSTGITQAGPLYLYAYSFALNSAKTVQSITLPTNANVVVVAIDVTAAAASQSPAATPTFSPAPGTYAGGQSVSLSDTTPGASIYYTINGATPTSTSTPYTGPIGVSATTTINAIAIATGYTTSPVATGAYTISGASGTTPVSVSLAGIANLYGLANSGTAVTGGGADGHNQAFAANLLGTTVTWSGGTFTLGAAGPGSAVTSKTIPLPAGNDTAISLLGSGVNGAQLNQAFVVTYTDGSTQTFTQSLSDWFTPANYAGETIAATTAYRVKSTGITQSGPYYLYAYSFTLNSAKTVQSITLPANANVVVVAIDVTAAAASQSPAATPTSASTLYTGPISVSATTTINAIAVATGYTTSPVASASYTIAAPANVALGMTPGAV
jgi:hypothetical protein